LACLNEQVVAVVAATTVAKTDTSRVTARVVRALVVVSRVRVVAVAVVAATTAARTDIWLVIARLAALRLAVVTVAATSVASLVTSRATALPRLTEQCTWK
jgi:uncharacterized membrane protein YqhA